MTPEEMRERWGPEIAAEAAKAPPIPADMAEEISALLSAAVHRHKPVLRHHQGRNRVDCTCGAQGLALVAPNAGMGPVIRAITQHRQQASQ